MSSLGQRLRRRRIVTSGLALTWADRLMTLLGRSAFVGYWRQGEASGATSRDSGPLKNHGAYTAVTLNQAGVSGIAGGWAAAYDGSTSYDNVLSAGLNNAFNGRELTILAWFKVSAASVWTDGAYRAIAYFTIDANNIAAIYKTNANNALRCQYTAGATGKALDITLNPTTWTFAVFSISLSANKAQPYLDAVKQGAAALTTLGTWDASPLTGATIGAGTTAPASVWKGDLQEVVLLNRALSQMEVIQVYRLAGVNPLQVRLYNGETMTFQPGDYVILEAA